MSNYKSTYKIADPVWFFLPATVALHFLIATIGGMFLGFFPEVYISKFYYQTFLVPYSPAIAICALMLGFFVSFRLVNLRTGVWTWVIGVLWFFVGFHELFHGWSASWSPEKTPLEFAFANLFGPTSKCSGSECLYELLFTTPLAASVMYSIGAGLRLIFRTPPDETIESRA